MKREIYWHLPGLCYFRFLNQILLNLMEKYPESFHEGYKIGSVYGSFPGAIWNGGRSVFGLTSKTDMGKIISAYNQKGVPVRFTWTNSLLEEKHLQDTYCNLIMEQARGGMNQVLANVPILEQYLRNTYPDFKVISSTTKRLVDREKLKEEMERDYHLVVLDYDLNHDESVLSMLEPYADKVEILVNEICEPNCPMRQAHYANQSLAQLTFDPNLPFKCPHDTSHRTFEECKKRPAFISREQIAEYGERGFVNFKIVGRGLPMEFAKESYLYYLVKEEYQSFIRGKIDRALADLSRQGGQIKR
ncbi:MAG: hypothetical protein IJY10_07895 [Lachnospiraceae bacterium]|nr:hypothetical protein [Lachnospiraceae bacterium]